MNEQKMVMVICKKKANATATATATLSIAVGLSGYLIQGINVPLLRGKVGKEAQSRLLLRWHCGNAMRLGLLAATEIFVRRVEASGSASTRESRN